MKKYKILLEFIKKEKTKDGAVPVFEAVKFSKEIWKVAKKFWYDCFMKAYPKSKANYKPTNKEYKIKTVEDIVKLTPEQFEFFIDDLREYCKTERDIPLMKQIPWVVSVKSWEWFTWVDDWWSEKNYNNYK